MIVVWSDEAGEEFPSDGHVETLPLRTEPVHPTRSIDQHTTVTAHVPSDRTLHIVAGGDKTTTEWLLDIPAGRTDGSVDLWLYPKELEVEFEGLITEPATQGATGPSWWPHTVVGEGGPDAARRLQSMEASLRWENDPMAGADLGIGVGDEALRGYQNPAYQIGVGTQEETWTFEREELEMLGVVDGDIVAIGPSVSTGQFALPQRALDYEGTAVLRFENTESPSLPPPCQEFQGGSREGTTLRIVVTLVGLLLAAVVAVLLAQSQGKKDG